MDAKGFLGQLLSAAQDLSTRGKNEAEKRLRVPEAGPERDAMLAGLGKGALAAGALALLLGTGAGRRLAGTAFKLGGLAAVGGLAYKAYQDWQQDQAGRGRNAGIPIDRLDQGRAQDRSRLLLQAMIAAAKADGHIDAMERGKIEREIVGLGLETDTARFLNQEINKPLDVATVAAGVDSPEVAAEVYLASRLVIDIDNERERAYLDHLAHALDLPADLVTRLESEIG